MIWHILIQNSILFLGANNKIHGIIIYNNICMYISFLVIKYKLSNIKNTNWKIK